jgi:transposase InsO family protein
LDNASIGSFFSHSKTEAIELHDIQDPQKAQTLLNQYIHYNNDERLQLKLNKLTPVEHRRQHAT